MVTDVLIPTSVLVMITRERDALRKERDRLRKALEEIIAEAEEAPCGPADPWNVTIQDIARAAIGEEMS